MNKDELYLIGLDKRNGKIKESWDSLNLKYGTPFINGESFRCYVKKRLKREGNIVSDNSKVCGTKSGQEEIKPKFTDCGDYYIINSGNRNVEITKNKLRQLKDLYCDDSPLTINQICRKLDLPRRDFFIIKTAFSITHDDVPYIDEDLNNTDMDTLVNQTLEKKKEQYFIKLQQQEIEQLKNELCKYRKNDYFYNKVIQEMSVPIKSLNFNIKTNINSETEGLLNLADWHTGLKVESFWNEYSLTIQKERLRILTAKTISYIKRHNVKKMHVTNLGDLLHGIIHVSTRISSEVDLIQQFRITWQLIADILIELTKEVEIVYFYSTYGNHSRITEKKQDALDRENLELLLPDVLKASLQNIKNIIFVPNKYDDQILIAKPCGHIIFGIHGDRDKPDKVAGNLTMMLDMKPYKIFTAHTHHKEVLEVHKVDVIISRSLCGVDDYAKDIRSTSRAGQSLYIFTPECLECTYDITFN